jgi:hypothetical protein
MAGIALTTVALAVFLGTLSEAAYKLAWPPNPETDRDGREYLKLKLAVGLVGTVAVAAYAQSTGGITGRVLPLFAVIEVAKGLPAAIKVADMEAAKRSKLFDIGLTGPMPKRKAVTTMFFGVTGFLEVLGFGLWSFIPAGGVLAYALARRFGVL